MGLDPERASSGSIDRTEFLTLLQEHAAHVTAARIGERQPRREAV